MSRASQLFCWRQEILESDLSSTDRLAALTLSQHMDADGGSCYPSVGRLARETRCHQRTIHRALRRLERRGWLVRDGYEVVGTPRGPQRVVRYRAAIPTQHGVAEGHPVEGVAQGHGVTLDTEGGGPEYRRGWHRATRGSQEERQEGRQPATQSTPATDNGKKRERARSRPTRAKTLLPDDWQPGESHLRIAGEEGRDLASIRVRPPDRPRRRRRSR